MASYAGAWDNYNIVKYRHLEGILYIGVIVNSKAEQKGYIIVYF